MPAEGGPQINPRRARHLLIAADMLATATGLLLAFLIQEVAREIPRAVIEDQLKLVFVSVPIWIASLSWNKLYIARAVERASDELRRIVRAVVMSIAAIIGLSFLIDYDALSRLWMFTVFVTVTSALVIERTIARRIFASLRRTGRLQRRIVIVGRGPDANALAENLENNPALGYKVCGFLAGPYLDDGSNVLGGYDDAERVLDEQHANGVIISPGSIHPSDVNALTRRLTDRGYHVALSSGLRDIDACRFRTQMLDGRTMLYVEPIIRGGWHASAKRAFDIVVAFIGMVLTAPLVLPAAVAIKLTSPGPVVFTQTRVGLESTTFKMYKLRTMVADAEEKRKELLDQNEADGPLFKMSNDPRITSVGRFLRRTSIDELPQFWNVLKGEMSIVGPRPALPHEVTQWTPEVHERIRVLPGITGLWQVSGRADTTFEDYARFDRSYVDNWSLGKDLGIVAKTIGAVMRSSGAR